MLQGGLRTKDIHKQSLPNEPLITVVTVVRNGEATLEETILSVVNQTYQNIEYIVIDGASVDGTVDIIKKYEDRIDYWVSEPDDGVYPAMNKVMGLATGDWVNFMNGGDRFYSNSVIENIAANFTDSDLVYGDYCRDNSNKIVKQSWKINRLSLLRERMVCHQSIFAKKSLLLKHPFDTNYIIVADRKFLGECFFDKVKIQYVPQIICIYNTSGPSSDLKQHRTWSLRLVREQFGVCGLVFAATKRFLAGILL